MCKRHTARDDDGEQRGEDSEVPATAAAARPDEVPAAAAANGATPSEADNFPRSVSERPDVHIVDAVIEMASDLARQSQFVGVSEAATLVSALASLISNDRGNVAETESRLNRCGVLLATLQRAATVLEHVRQLDCHRRNVMVSQTTVIASLMSAFATEEL